MFSVLIVEDDPMVAMINEQYVSKNRKFSVAGSVRNGQDAISFLEKNPVDLIVLDVFMPYMNGIETLKKIREKKISSDVIMVTAANDPSTLEETMNLGVVDYLIKPFAYDRFQVALEKFESRFEALKNADVLDQSKIDSIMTSRSEKKAKSGEKNYPKGIQETTLNRIMDYFRSRKEWICGETAAENLGISSVTVRHYMSYLVKNNYIEESVNYGTGGRPSMLYRFRQD